MKNKIKTVLVIGGDTIVNTGRLHGKRIHDDLQFYLQEEAENSRKMCLACCHYLPIYYFDKEDICYMCEPLLDEDQKLI